MAYLKKIKSIDNKIRSLMKNISDPYIRQLKTYNMRAWIDKNGKPRLKQLKEEDPLRKEFVVLTKNTWTELHFILTADNNGIQPSIVLFRHITFSGYKWNNFRLSTKKSKDIENTRLGAIIAGVIYGKYGVSIDYRPSWIVVSYDFKTDFDFGKVTEKLKKFNLLIKKIEKEIPSLAKTIKSSPKKYSKVNPIW